MPFNKKRQEVFPSFLWLFVKLPLIAATSSAAVVLAATGNTTLYPIDASQRGFEITNSFKSLDHASGAQLPEIAIQTTLTAPPPYQTYKYMINGIIPYVQSITQTPHNTLLIITYAPAQTPSILQYIVLPTEQVVELLHFTFATQPITNAPFTSSVISGTIPFYSVDSKERAEDIVSAVTQLLASPFKTLQINQVWIQTTLNGPFNPSIPNGLLKNVTGIFVDNSLIRIQFLQPNQSITQTVFVSPEQIQQILYIRDLNSP